MASKLKMCQAVALATGIKPETQKAVTKIHHMVPDLFTGFARKFVPLHEGGELKTSEGKRVQFRATEVLETAFAAWQDLVNKVATQDVGNCVAKADIKVGETVVLKDVPVTHMLFLEKHLKDMETFVSELPVLDPAFDWTWDSSRNCYVTSEQEVIATKKTPRVITLAPATTEHPAQAQLIQEDVPCGTWKRQDFSAAIPEERKQRLLRKIRDTTNAVKLAREEANGTVVEFQDFGDKLMKFLAAD